MYVYIGNECVYTSFLKTRRVEQLANTHQHLGHNYLRVVQWNAERIQQRKPELLVFLKDNSVDVICVQETHFRGTHRFFVRGFEMFRQDRPSGHKEGVLTLVRNGIPAVQAEQIGSGDLEFLTIKLLASGELYIPNCYSPPNSKTQS